MILQIKNVKLVKMDIIWILVDVVKVLNILI